jgi:2-polyprenyl-6-methoxyphenol hydroxylase-like FAD-dependent oxidoreductase
MSRAVVVGGSIAGMCAARVLSDVFDEVVILDRDEYPDEAAARSGVPQSRHAHALLGRGQDELEKLFPGFVAAMRAGGALMFDAGVGFAMRRAPGWQHVGPNGIETLWSSRDLLEFTVRSLLRKQSRVQLREGCHVLGLRAERGNPLRVTGVRIRSERDGEQELAADLVMDASGRNTRAEAWLGELGVPLPETQRVDAHAGYASRFYKPPPRERRPRDWWWQGLWVEWQLGVPRGGVIFPIEGDRWLVTCAGIGDGEHPPIDEPGFLAFLRTFSSPAIARAVALAEPISPICGNRSLANVYRRYDQWRHQLHGFVAGGDSVCTFNPIYGQGMSSAAACSSILAAVLRARGPRPGFERELFRRQGEFLTSVWNLATGADFQWPTTEGERPRMPPGVGEYVNLALQCAHNDAALRRHLTPVFNLSGSMTLFFHPSFVARVLARAGRDHLEQRLFGAPQIPDAPPAPGF